MKNFALTLDTVTMLCGAAFTACAASAAPIGPGGMQTSSSGMTQVRMMYGDRMMMKKRMLREKMMNRRMKQMMNRM